MPFLSGGQGRSGNGSNRYGPQVGKAERHVVVVCLAEDPRLQIPVVFFLERAAPDTYRQPVVNAVIQTEPDRGAVEPKPLLQSAINPPEAVRYFKVQYACRRIFDAMPVDQPGCFECL
jgi:hypothetical protein